MMEVVIVDDGNRLTVYELVERVIPCIIAKHYSENYIQGFRSTFRNLLAYCNKNEKEIFYSGIGSAVHAGLLRCAAGNSRTAMLTSSPCNGFVVRLPTFQRGYASAEVESRVPCRTARRCGQLLAKAISPRTQGEYAAQPQKCSSSLYRLFVQRWSHGLQITFSRYCKSIRQSCFVQLQQFGCKAPLQYPFTLFSVPCA